MNRYLIVSLESDPHEVMVLPFPDGSLERMERLVAEFERLRNNYDGLRSLRIGWADGQIAYAWDLPRRLRNCFNDAPLVVDADMLEGLFATHNMAPDLFIYGNGMRFGALDRFGQETESELFHPDDIEEAGNAETVVDDVGG